jgi:hypothetical protein
LFFDSAIINKRSTLVSTSGELTFTTTAMASQGDQAASPSATKLVLLTTGGSSFEPANKKQKKEAQHKKEYNMLEYKYLSSSPNGPMYRLLFIKKTFSLRITLTMMPWS